MNKIRILNIDVLNITRQQLLENLHEGVLITPNLDHLIKLQKDKDFLIAIKRQNGWYAIQTYFDCSQSC
jgi:hypothetical protein